MSDKPVFKEILQVALVVKNIDETVRKYWEIYGIGPWQIYTMVPADMRETTVRGKETEFGMKAAFTTVGNVQLELIEPLDDNSIYSEFLEKHGEGLHHIACAVDNFDETLSRLKNQGVRVLQGGITKENLGFAYLDTQDTLSCIAEIYDFPENFELPPPDATYP